MKEKDEIKEAFLNRSIPLIYLEGISKIEEQMQKCVCKIKFGDIIGTGFFCKIKINDKEILPVLITNYHVVNENNIKNGKNKIKVSLFNEAVFKVISIDIKKKFFFDKDLDVTFIEINIQKDEINDFLEIDEKVIYEKENLNDIYSSKSIYTINYPKGENVAVSFGFLSEINNNDIVHSCNTEYGSSGSPIILLNTFKVIGIHHGFDNSKEMNKGTFIQFAIDQFLKYNMNIEDENKDIKIENSKTKSDKEKEQKYNNFIINKKTELSSIKDTYKNFIDNKLTIRNKPKYRIRIVKSNNKFIDISKKFLKYKNFENNKRNKIVENKKTKLNNYNYKPLNNDKKYDYTFCNNETISPNKSLIQNNIYEKKKISVIHPKKKISDLNKYCNNSNISNIKTFGRNSINHKSNNNSNYNITEFTKYSPIRNYDYNSKLTKSPIIYLNYNI